MLINKIKIIIPVIVVSFLICGISALGVEKHTGISDKEDEERSDIINIDFMKSMGDLERPAVIFFHDRHTDALEGKNKDCKTCHKTKDDRLSPKFMRLEDTGRQDVMDIYHNNCITCHNETAVAGEKGGPVICGECHREKPAAISARQPMGLDQSLHFRHLRAHEKKCELCHHEYDEKTKKLFYAKEKESSCRYCHKKETAENRISIELAAHASCIACHMQTMEEKKKAGPVKCKGCHDLKEQQLIEKVDLIPRIERKQPDMVMIKTGNQDLDSSLKNRMNFVPFDHKAHEGYNDTCRVCHHQDLSKCNKCHTLEGLKDGKNIILEQAMHQPGIEHSCRGCHAIKQNDKNCSGCHAFLGKNRKQDHSSCLKCHIKPLPGEAVAVGPTSNDAAAAEKLLALRKTVSGTYDNKEIPEKVIIKDLTDKYEPVEFPHLKIVMAIVKNIKDNKLSSYFHTEKGTVCQGCHHNSPADVKPPRCGSCHAKLINEKEPLKPGIMGAYHIQCMECHNNMFVDKVGCTDCHKEKEMVKVENEK